MMQLPASAYNTVQQPEQSFAWGAGGSRLTPDELARRQKIADAMMAPDYSPVGHWTQGLARVAQNIVGALDSRKLDKQSEANAAESDAVLQALMGDSSGNGAVVAALSNPYVSDEVRQVAGKVWDRQNPKPAAPHYWETNNGSLGVVGNDGQPRILYDDPTPKISWITADNPDGTKSIIPVGPNGPVTATEGGGQQSPVSGATMPPTQAGSVLSEAQRRGYLTPEEYASLQAELGPQGKTAMDGWLKGSGISIGQQVDGKTYYQINGKWYDNPEGR